MGINKRTVPSYAGSELTRHAMEMMMERNIDSKWVKETLNYPDTAMTDEDGMIHFTKIIPEYGGRHLRIIINPSKTPPKIITLFFDRSLKEKNET